MSQKVEDWDPPIYTFLP